LFFPVSWGRSKIPSATKRRPLAAEAREDTDEQEELEDPVELEVVEVVEVVVDPVEEWFNAVEEVAIVCDTMVGRRCALYARSEWYRVLRMPGAAGAAEEGRAPCTGNAVCSPR
jgi:hypothetical protein|tara:strand:- start:240 stop:581 length:342 start_codon:yes stop_codon:yes gene_type:complete